ncbi:protein involved in DNA mediated transformation [Arthrobacter sp. Hiyo8]|nr:protein involved in DNA mediated transformation [Arthrobacter sp. Hiyo8]
MTEHGQQLTTDAPERKGERLARAALSRLMEPQDAAGLALVKAAGAVDGLKIATGELAPGPGLEQEVASLLVDSGVSNPGPDWLLHYGGGRQGSRTLPRNVILPPCNASAAVWSSLATRYGPCSWQIWAFMNRCACGGGDTKWSSHP